MNVDIESYLRKSLIRGMSVDNLSNNFKTDQIRYNPKGVWGLQSPEETRTIQPAWEIRDLEQNRWDPQIYNPQENVHIPFPNQLQTRIIERDNFKPTYPTLQ